MRNTHLRAIAPTVSNSKLSGNVSPGIEPWAANVLIKLNNMKNLIYISLIALLSSCSGSQLFLEARTTYNVPLNHDGQINTKIVINGIK